MHWGRDPRTQLLAAKVVPGCAGSPPSLWRMKVICHSQDASPGKVPARESQGRVPRILRRPREGFMGGRVGGGSQKGSWSALF